MTPLASAICSVGLLLCLLCGALNAAGCDDSAITLREIWSCRPAGSGLGVEVPVAVLPNVGVLTRTSENDGTKTVFRVRSLASGAVMSKFADGPFREAGVDSTGRYVATSLGLWDAQTGRRLAEFAVPPGHNCMCVAVSPDGRAVLSAGNMGDVLLYKVEHLPAPNPLQPLLLGRVDTRSVQHVAFSPDGQRALALELGTRSWLIWDTKSWGPPTGVGGKQTPPSGDLGVPWKGFYYESRLVDWDTGRTIWEIDPPQHGRLTEPCLLSGNKGILLYFQGERTDFYRDHALRLFGLSGVLVATRPLSSSVWPVAFSSDGQYMITQDLVPAPPPFPGLEVLDKNALGPIRCWRVGVK